MHGSTLCLLPSSCMCGMLQVTPIIQADGVSYMYVQYSNLYLLVVTRENVNATSMLLFLHKLKEVFVHYFNELEEESLRDNFVIAYELLDEVLLCLPWTCLGLSACLVQSLILHMITRAALTWQRGRKYMLKDQRLQRCHSIP